MHTYPNTTIARPSSPVTREELIAERDTFRMADFMGEQLLIRPISISDMRTQLGNRRTVQADVLVLTGARKGYVFGKALVFDSNLVGTLTDVMDSPHVQSIAGLVDKTIAIGETLPTRTLIELPSEADIAYADEQARALRWSTGTPATDKELLGWNLAQARKDSRISQSDAAQMVGWAQPQLSAVESGMRSVTALELRELARLYRTTMARLLP